MKHTSAVHFTHFSL